MREEVVEVWDEWGVERVVVCVEEWVGERVREEKGED